jgi:hypothetical protein
VSGGVGMPRKVPASTVSGSRTNIDVANLQPGCGAPHNDTHVPSIPARRPPSRAYGSGRVSGFSLYPGVRFGAGVGLLVYPVRVGRGSAWHVLGMAGIVMDAACGDDDESTVDVGDTFETERGGVAPPGAWRIEVGDLPNFDADLEDADLLHKPEEEVTPSDERAGPDVLLLRPPEH